MVALLGLQCWITRNKLDWEAASWAVCVEWWPEKNLVMWASWLLGASGKVWPDSCLIFKPYHIHSGPQYTLLLCFHESEQSPPRNATYDFEGCTLHSSGGLHFSQSMIWMILP